ncbi:phospholipase D-like domain-containing protein [Nonomuraea sp. NPDC052129]|uniref:phospholipase D-like domain-containing protein n=1 Tax=Nonomuraea sp. NPDC052129 TaxID=3154651 RepID=UPI00343FF247
MSNRVLSALVGAVILTALLAGGGPATASATSAGGGTATASATPVGDGQTTAAVSATTCADAPDEPVAKGAVFNDPVGGDPTAIVRRLCGLIHQTPAGARIQVAHFVMSGQAGTDFAGELIKAHQRGVEVRVILDGDTRGATVATQLATALGTDISASSYLHVCTGPPSGGTAACVGSKGQHNKFYLFSRTGGVSDVVVQSSANLTDLNSATYWNNAVVLPRDKKLYRAYDSYFQDLAAERKNPDYYRSTTTRSGQAWFFPRAGMDATTDTVAEHLAKVRCTPGTQIRVGMSEWDTYRIAIPEKLRDLAAQGCSVKIVYGIMADEVKQLLLAEPRIELRTLGTGDALPGRIHSKYLLIEGSFEGHAHARVVLTGSHNYIESSLRRNDETLLRLDDQAMYRQYVANFERLRAVAPLAATS